MQLFKAVLDFKIDLYCILETKSNLDNNSNKKPLGSTQQENSQEADKNHSSEHSSDSCNTDDAEAPPLKIVKRMLRKKRSVSSADEQWAEASYQENSNR